MFLHRKKYYFYVEPMDPKNMTASQRYYQKNKEWRQEYGREYYQKNKDYILALYAEKRERQRQLRDNPPPPLPTVPVIPSPPETRSPSPIAQYKRRGPPVGPLITHQYNLTLEFD